MYKEEGVLSSTAVKKFGWMVKAPSPPECHTGHRYLRSPVDSNLYLGGPVSLINFDRDANTQLMLCPRQGFVGLVTKRPLLPGNEVSWSYTFMHRSSPMQDLNHKNKWFLDFCCSETNQAPSNGKRLRKEVGNSRPLKMMKVVETYLWCPFSGRNLEEGKKKVNLKEHLAVRHAVDVCHAMNVKVDEQDPAKGVAYKDFCTYLDLLAKVYRSLSAFGYHVLPACRFLLAQGIDHTGFQGKEPPPSSNYEAFLSECKDAFKKYKVIQLKGLEVPASVKDLYPSEVSSFKDVMWKGGKRPASNIFTADRSKEEELWHKLNITTTLNALVDTFNRM